MCRLGSLDKRMIGASQAKPSQAKKLILHRSSMLVISYYIIVLIVASAKTSEIQISITVKKEQENNCLNRAKLSKPAKRVCAMLE